MKVGEFQIGRYHAIIRKNYADGSVDYETSFSDQADLMESVYCLRLCIGKMVGLATDTPKVLTGVQVVRGEREYCPGTGGKAAMNKTRPKQLSFRVSEEEYQQLQEKISESGKNQQEYILSCVLEKQIVNTDGIKELIPELKRIGNNLNQIAKRCNEGGMLPSEAEVRKHGEELNKVWQSLRRYLQRRA